MHKCYYLHSQIGTGITFFVSSREKVNPSELASERENLRSNTTRFRRSSPFRENVSEWSHKTTGVSIGQKYHSKSDDGICEKNIDFVKLKSMLRAFQQSEIDVEQVSAVCNRLWMRIGTRMFDVAECVPRMC